MPDWLNQLLQLVGVGGGGSSGVGTIDPNTGFPVPYFNAAGQPGNLVTPTGPSTLNNPAFAALFNQGWSGASGGGGGSGGSNPLAIIAQLLGLGGGAYYGNQQLHNLSNIYKQQQQDAQIAMNPAALAARVAAATPQLNSQLAYTVNQAADLGTAGRGMAQSPGAVAAGRAEALAPYGEQNLQLGSQLAEFGFPYAFSQNPPNYLSVLQQLQNYGQTSTGLPGVS